jgi:hypothetical protein
MEGEGCGMRKDRMRILVKKKGEKDNKVGGKKVEEKGGTYQCTSVIG